MPRLIPENPSFPQDRDAEKKVWTALKDQLPPDAVLIHGLRIVDRAEDREGDLVVLWPGNGIAVIEVKGGHITAKPDGTFSQRGSDGHVKHIDPIDQARLAMYTIQKWLNRNTSIRAHYNYTFMAALPFTTFNSNWRSKLAERNQIIDQGDLVKAASQVREALANNAGRAVAPDAFTVEQIVNALETEVLDAHNPVHLAELLDQRTRYVESLLRENSAKLAFVDGVRRFEVVGPAGTGKTAMAIELAHRLTERGERVLFMCYTALLAAHLRHLEEDRPRESRIAAIQTLHGLGTKWGIRVPQEPNPDFWEVECPQLIKQAAQAAPESERFDAIVVDEAQDFSPLWWDTVQSLLRDPANGRIHVFSDTGQTLYDRPGGVPFDVVPLRLHVNLRNTQEIGIAANRFTDTPAPCIGPDGPEIMLCEVPEGASVTKAGDTIAAAMLNVYRPQDVALITTYNRHPEHRALEKIGRDHYLRQYWQGEDIFYSTVMKFKGLERHCVVLVVNGFLDVNRAREILYVGLTRAQDLLVLVSHRSTIEPHLTADFIEQLESHRLDLEPNEYEYDTEHVDFSR